jgi:hypothetical protein
MLRDARRQTIIALVAHVESVRCQHLLFAQTEKLDWFHARYRASATRKNTPATVNIMPMI